MFGQTSKAKIILLTVATLLLTTGFNAVFPSSQASADVKSTPYLQDVYVDSVYKKLSANQHYWFLYSCFRNVNINKVTKAEVDGWDFFEGSGAKSALGAMYAPSDNGYYRDCSTGSMVKTAFNYLGFDSSRETFCSIKGAQYEDGNKGNFDDCNAGAGGKNWDNNASLNEVTNWFKDRAGPEKPAFGAPENYVRSFASFVEGCDISFNNDTLYNSADDVPGAGTSKTQYAVPVIVKQGDSLVTKYVQGVGMDDNKAVVIVATSQASETAVLPATFERCGALINSARDNVEAYRLIAEKEGVTGTGNDLDAGTGAEETTCGIDGIGWIVCPVITFMAKLNDYAFGFLQSLLAIRPALISDPATLKAWSAFRDIANVAFIIAFLIIVYSQITGVGVSNYGIKKLLPRIFISAVLVNLSYFICALAVDASNIVGSSVYSLLGDAIPVGTDGETNGDFANGWQDTVGPILAAAATGVVLLVVIIPVLPAVLLALAVILFILIARQALVILLIVVAPLAFVAYLLPNTESWFKKWRQAFVAVLMVYPIIGVIFGASTLAATILMGVSNDTASDNNDEQLLKIVALAVLAVPLFAVPSALKGSLSAAGAVGAKIGGLADKTNKMAGSSIRDRTKDLNNKRKIAALGENPGFLARAGGGFGLTKRRALRDSLRSSRDNEAKRAASTYTASQLGDKDDDGEYKKRAKNLQRAAAGGGMIRNADPKAQVRAAALATQSIHKQFDDDQKAFRTTQTSDTHDELMSKSGNMKLSVEERSAAAGSIAARSYREGHNQVLEQVHAQMKEADEAYNAAADGSKEKDDARKQVEDLSTIQKQVVSDLKDKPFGLGEKAMGELGEGTYGRVREEKQADGSVEVKAIASIREETKTRAGSKLNAQTVASLNPDDLTRITNAAVSDDPDEQLKTPQLQNVVNKIFEARQNPNIKGLIKEEANVKFDLIIDKARERGLTIPGVTDGTATAVTEVAAARAYSGQQVRTMGPENTQRAVDSRGGVEALHEFDLVAIRNTHGSEAVGQAARDELVRRGAIEPPSPRNLP